MQQQLYFLQFMGGMASLVLLEGMPSHGSIASANALGLCEDDSVLKATCRFWSLKRRQGF